MGLRIFLLLIVALLFAEGRVLAAEQTNPEENCPPGSVQSQYSSGACSAPQGAVFPFAPEKPLSLPFPKQTDRAEKIAVPVSIPDKAGPPKPAENETIVYFFWGKGCPHCEEERKFLEGMKRELPNLEVRDYEVWHNKENAGMMALMLEARGARFVGVPVTFVSDHVYSGFTARSRPSIEKTIKMCSLTPCADPSRVLSKAAASGQAAQPRPFAATTSATTGMESKDTFNIPLLGNLNARDASLPLLTLVIAGMDSFNPCAFFVLLSLLGMLVHARSRNKMLLIGAIFVFFSGFIYFLFMAAWLNLFLVMGQLAVITTVAGSVSVLIAAINIKDFFLFKQGLSLTIPDSAKPKLFERMRKLLRSDSLVSILIGTTVLAIVANFYELLCTAGFPMVFTRILTLNNLSTPGYYLYLVLYNVIYVIPLLIIVLAFSLTLGKRQLSEWQGRVLKLVSGVMMLGLGIILLTNPTLLNSVLVSFIILISALGVSLLIAMLTKRLGH